MLSSFYSLLLTNGCTYCPVASDVDKFVRELEKLRDDGELNVANLVMLAVSNQELAGIVRRFTPKRLVDRVGSELRRIRALRALSAFGTAPAREVPPSPKKKPERRRTGLFRT